MQKTEDRDLSFYGAFLKSILGMKDALIPGYCLLGIAALVVLSYYSVESVKNFLDFFAVLKGEWGFAFSIPCMALFGGFFPWLFAMYYPGLRPKYPVKTLIFFVTIWCFQGLFVDALYRTQAWMFGDEASFLVVLKKMLFDQFVYTFLFASPYIAVTYLWKDMNFSFTRVKAAFAEGHWYKRIMLPNYLANLMIWIPGVCILYSLPSGLQLFMASIIGCLFSILSSYISARVH